MLLDFMNPTPARLASESVAGRLTLLRLRGGGSTDSLDRG
jgi:hypothetical protein